MILNPFSVLAAFAAVLRIAIGLLVLFAGVRAMRRWRSSRHREVEAGEERFYLLLTLSATLVGLAVVSWPLLYLVLQSYVPEWPGVMCIQGVTRIGTGSIGASGWLPGLVAFLETAKPALVFVAGGWLVLHLVNRRDRTGALTGRVLGALLLCGLLAALDGAGELLYLLIPNQERFLAAGCCSFAGEPVAAAGAEPIAHLVARQDGSSGGLTIAFFSVGLALLGTITLALRRRASRGVERRGATARRHRARPRGEPGRPGGGRADVRPGSRIGGRRGGAVSGVPRGGEDRCRRQS